MTKSKHEKKKAIDYYMERQELTHRMRIKAAWMTWCLDRGSDPHTISGNFRKLAKDENWAIRWTGERKTRDQIVGDISRDFAQVLTGQAIVERQKTELSVDVMGLAFDHVAELVEKWDRLSADEREKELDMIATFARIIKNLGGDKVFYERATNLFDSE